MTPINFESLSEEVKKFVQSYFRKQKNNKLVFHSLAHTEDVVQSAIEIANYYKLNKQDLFIVETATWFHDVGYFIEEGHHEEKGAEMAESF